MAIDSYANLQTAIASWLDSSETTLLARIPDFIALFEARAKRLSLLRSMETEDTLTTTVALDYVALPAGFISPIAAWIEINGFRKDLEKRQPQDFDGSPTLSLPRFYAIDNANMLFDCPAADVYSIPLRYMKSFALSDATTTNYLLEQAPDAYLFGALAESAPFTKDFDKIAVWEQKVQRAMREQNAIESRSRSVSLRSDLPSFTRRSNIFSGD